MTAEYRVESGVAVVTLNNPPVNGLNHATRQGIVEAVTKANQDDAVRAIVITGGSKIFSGGADIREFNTPRMSQAPHLGNVIEVLESSAKPVVAAVSGTAMGGGLELAMGCHYRVAAAQAQIALPEVKLGLLPGAGGTQRLPRLVGLEAALNMIVSGDAVPAKKLAGTKLFDEVLEGDPLPAAIALAGKVAGAEKHPRARDIRIDFPEAEGYLGWARMTVAATAPQYPAPLRCVDAVTAAVTDKFDAALKKEFAYFHELSVTPESRALRHAFFAERAAQNIPDVPADTPIREIKLAAVIGAGTMGGGIAMNFVNAGIPVKLLEMKQEALDRGLATIRKNYENTAKKGRITQEQVEERMGLLQPTMSYDDIADADIVIEAVFERFDVKEQVFQTLDKVMKQGAILATNTSTLDVDRIAAVTARPQDVIGTHFFSPANVMKLLEVVRGEKTAKDVLATVMKLAKKLKKTAVVSGVCDGFIGNRMVEQYTRQAGFMLEEGATPAQVDGAIERFGFAMGPFRMSDLAGNDIGYDIRQRRYQERPDMHYGKLADYLIEKFDRKGQKVGKGWYDYKPGDRKAIPSAEVEQLIVDYRKEVGTTPRKISDAEIVQRLVFSLVNEACHILEEGIALRASDIDVVYLTGYGFPAYRGGPMQYANEFGLYNVMQAMESFARNPHADPAFWQPAPLLRRLVAEGKNFE
ncbi:3-hydroxyacyl-CoA dehydrogenase [Verticiella sediminum]|uniref:3-hydroxyacyl-CoA dehydrogenase n=1 Tax=Verticiella sediminum TaxID=1247510 RepID=A0A556AM12_9BURK|nr:3-hydroxyacyl-CoA dehydrogenase NAD-binding domain-containing protein [Verticiella sediminum]TSH93905.1 3-hydroxyacyl-CoA dehydrogenase [Verticiella sediminum]